MQNESNILHKQRSPPVEQDKRRFPSFRLFFFKHPLASRVPTRFQKGDTSSRINGQHGLTQILLS